MSLVQTSASLAILSGLTHVAVVFCESKFQAATERMFASLVLARIGFLEFLWLFKLLTAASQSEYIVDAVSKWDNMASETSIR